LTAINGCSGILKYSHLSKALKIPLKINNKLKKFNHHFYSKVFTIGSRTPGEFFFDLSIGSYLDSNFLKFLEREPNLVIPNLPRV